MLTKKLPELSCGVVAQEMWSGGQRRWYSASGRWKSQSAMSTFSIGALMTWWKAELETMLAMVAAGVGIAVAPEGLVRRRVRNIAVRHLPPGSALSEIGLAVRSYHDDPLIRNLRQGRYLAS